MESLFIICAADPVRIVEAFVKVLTDVKGSFLLGISLFTMGYVGYQSFIGGQDKRTIMNNAITLIIFAIIVYSLPYILGWLQNLAG